MLIFIEPLYNNIPIRRRFTKMDVYTISYGILYLQNTTLRNKKKYPTNLNLLCRLCPTDLSAHRCHSNPFHIHTVKYCIPIMHAEHVYNIILYLYYRAVYRQDPSTVQRIHPITNTNAHTHTHTLTHPDVYYKQ